MDSPAHNRINDSEKSEIGISASDDDSKKPEELLQVLSCLPTEETLDDFPDGGFRAWLVLFGGFCIFFSTWGYVTSWGVFQAYYQETILRGSSPSEIAWIGSLQHSIIFLPGLIVGRLFDIGLFRIPFAAGSVLIVLATFLVPLCRTFTDFLLCQGLATGLGCALVIPPTIAVVCHWWKRRRAFALGVMTCGSALSGTIIPIVVRRLLEVVGFAWTLRIIGFMLTFTLGVANMCVARRLPPIKPAGRIFNWSVFRNSAFLIYCAAQFVVSLGSYIGAMNVMIIVGVFVAALTRIWPQCRSVASITMLSVFFGFTNASYSPLTQVPAAAMGSPSDLGLRIGILSTFLGLGTLCGPPLGGLLNDTRLGYAAVGYFGGGMLLVGTVLMTVSRFLAVPRLWSRY
ncbi:MFS general substrate transporter [Mycena capillaripes]|nr:MFS general substrate transporter [Mycena capillaripes]